MPDEVMTTREAANYLNVLHTYVYQLVWAKRILGRRDETGIWRLDRKSVEAYQETRRKRISAV
jgi:excisionase family DNA binding protein